MKLGSCTKPVIAFKKEIRLPAVINIRTDQWKIFREATQFIYSALVVSVAGHKPTL